LPLDKRVISLKRDSLILIFAEFFAIIFGLLSQVILTRGLLSEDYGLWIVVFDAALTLFILADPGISTFIGRELPTKLEKSVEFIYSTLKIQLLILPFFILFSILLYAMYPFFIVLICIGGLSLASSSCYKSFLRSTGRANWEAIIRVFDRLFLTLGYFIIFSLDGDITDFAIILCVIPSFSLFIIIFLCLVHSKQLSKENSSNTSKKYYYPIVIIRKSLPFFMFIILFQIMDRMDKFFLALNVPYEDLATYGIALIVYFAGLTIPRIIRNILLPWFSESLGNDEEIRNKFIEASKFVYFLTPVGIISAQLIMMTIPIVVFPEEYIFPDHERFSSESIFRILLISWSLNLLMAPSFEMIRSFGSPTLLNSISFISVSGSALFGLIFVPEYGVYGAAGLTCVAPLLFIITSHNFLISSLKITLSFRYYSRLIVLILYSFTPILFFIPMFSAISGFILLCFLSFIMIVFLINYGK